MKLLKIFFAFLLTFGTCPASFGQVSVKDSIIHCSAIGASYGFQLPGGDLAKRFGASSDIRLTYFYKTKKNWIFDADAGYFFGRNVKEDGILDSIKTADGHVINQNGEFAEVRLFERGYSANLRFGKLIPKFATNKNSGLVFMLGAGFMQHKIKIDDIGNLSPQLTKEMKKGYDRLTNGFCTSQFIGYFFLGNKRLVNFFGGFEFTQAFTKSRRVWDYDLMSQDTKKRLDLMYGFRVGWILPLYKRVPNEFYYY